MASLYRIAHLARGLVKLRAGMFSKFPLPLGEGQGGSVIYWLLRRGMANPRVILKAAPKVTSFR